MFKSLKLKFKFRFKLKAAFSVCVMTALVGSTLAQTPKTQAGSYPGVGRDATPKEVAAWDIDVRPDFKGLPPGSGTVAKGQDVWESKCASCHGIFGESNEVFSPLVGGVTADDIKTGRVARLKDPSYPGRTTMMKVGTVSTLWDYINRAMPWSQPKSLTTEEVYAVTAFLLNLSGVVPDDFTLSDKTIADVQKRMPNRNGMTTAHALWPGKEFGGLSKPDTHNIACMKNCATEPKLASFLPDFARNQHGNLADQNRAVGEQHGVDTTRPEAKVLGAVATTSGAATVKPTENSDNKAAITLTQKHTCVACHSINQKLVGPAFVDVAKKYGGKVDYIAAKIKSGGTGIWGSITMPPQGLSDADAKVIATWLAAGAAK